MAGTWIEEAGKLLKESDRPLHHEKEIMPKITGLGAVLELEDWWDNLEEGKIDQDLLEKFNEAIKADDGRYDYVDIPLISKEARIEKDNIDSDENRCWRIIDKVEYRLYRPKDRDEIRLENLDKAKFVHNSRTPERSIKRNLPEDVQKVNNGEYHLKTNS